MNGPGLRSDQAGAPCRLIPPELGGYAAESMRKVAFTLVVAALFGSGAPPHGHAQALNVSRAAADRIPRTPDGHPDMQGVWVHGTSTPFERAPELGVKATYTEDELRDAQRQAAERRALAAKTPRPGDVGGDNEAFVDSGYPWQATRQTSLVVEPPDGRLPIRPDALKRAAFHNENRDDYETMSPWDRCITRSPTLMLPAGYNNGTRIIQTHSHVVIESEMIHEARIVPTDGSPHRASHLRTWTGDPRGRWEGDTLVVDSTNYMDRGWLSTHAGSGRLRALPNSGQLHVVERFTLVDRDTIEYKMAVDDPVVFTAPWSVALQLRRDGTYQLFEFACHEGNQAVDLVLRGARFEERQPAR